MRIFNRNDLNDIWDLRHLTVKDFLTKLAQHPNYKFLLTVIGFLWLTGAIIAITVGINVIYYLFQVFQVVLK